jgi:hypothetical protein
LGRQPIERGTRRCDREIDDAISVRHPPARRAVVADGGHLPLAPGDELGDRPRQLRGDRRARRAPRVQRVGTVEEVLVEGSSRTDASLLRGRTRGNVTVVFTGEASPGELADVEIAAATSTTLRGAQRTAVAA